jgi:SSS family solute:Na+ symporter
VSAMPSGARGAMLAAILAVAMSNASGSLNSLAASSVIDFQHLRGLGEMENDPRRLLRRSRWMTVVWGVALAALATIRWGPMLEAGLTIAAITLGSLLGLFLLTFLFPRATAAGVLTGMFAGLAVILYARFRTPLLWTWYVPLSTVTTFAIGVLCSVATSQSRVPASEPR